MLHWQIHNKENSMKDYANYQPKKQARTESVWEVIATGLGFIATVVLAYITILLIAH